MGFLDGIVKGLADMVPDQGNPDLKAFKAKNELKELAAKENDIFARLGKQVYADGADRYPAIKAELDAIATMRNEVESRIRAAAAEADAQKRALQAEEMRCCPSCGSSNADGAAFCRDCGSRLTASKRCCPSCGTEMSPESRFCMECGSKVEAGS